MNRVTLRHLLLASLFVFFFVSDGFSKSECKAVYGQSARLFTLATGSPGELGLLEKLADEFNREHGTSMCWQKAGSGKSLALLKNKEVDLVMVHAPAAEKKAVEDGWAIKRTLIGSNEFYIVGPADDPAGIRGAGSAAEAYKMIAAKQLPFLSRGDNSGTHKKELNIWKTAGVTPEGDWYVVTKDFMMATLKKANDIGGYFMTDSSTWVVGQKDFADLKILFKGDPVLINTYHGLCQPEGATVGQEAASKFIDFLSSEAGQSIIRTYGEADHGAPMYNDADYARQYEH
ncbi:substrate-binding domain-containing protein [Desulforhopalus sp. IMCC35007]|uniref:substrate-binding domain-containing protein n=1 Tax=Desulforhopalus sp. IMCC35007 TaxID=2569543 RepID=UPI0010AE4A70|nr:substrate-binding domain-containing protein [Desulforhopalus sp. IMCC35007]TKB07654.1 ABC transporter substrate-binding protein [Desulforhopalus sp. IMCC35007]